MITDNSRTQISEPSSIETEKRNSSKDQSVLAKSLDELEPIQMEDEVKNELMTIINLVINSGELKPWLDTCGKPQSFTKNITTKFNGNQSIKIVQWNCRSLRIKFPEFEQSSQNVDIIIPLCGPVANLLAFGF
jgi:hypothetical protein